MTLPVIGQPSRLSTDFIFVYASPVKPGEEDPDLVTDWGSPLTNVVGHSGGDEANDEEWRHYGTGKQTELDVIDYPVTLSLEASTNLEDLGLPMGFVPPTTKVSLKDSTPVHIAMAGYTSDGGIVEVEYWSNVKWNNFTSGGSAGTSVAYKTYELSGNADNRYVTDGSETSAPKYTPPTAKSKEK